MNPVEYTVVSVNLDLGTIEVAIKLPDDSTDVRTFELFSIAVTDADPAFQLKYALDQMVTSRYQELFPLPKPKPPAALELLGQALVTGQPLKVVL